VNVKDATVREKSITETGCPACAGMALESFYTVDQVPVNSCILMASCEEALAYPKGDIDLTYCHDCGFVFNARFDEKLIEYSGRYEETQGYSETFNAFHKRLAEELIAKHDLRGKEVLEIGCGKGEFLTLICELGDNRGTGFDPSYVAERSRASRSSRTTFVTDFYSEGYTASGADLLCCKMTLEHIPRVAHFVSMVRATIGEGRSTVVFFQVPEASKILKECRFWDIYYEHCSYFDRASLEQLFTACGFQVTESWVDYDGQYLMIEALPAAPGEGLTLAKAETTTVLAETERAMRYFARAVPGRIAEWKRVVADLNAEKRRVVLWGSGSKAVSFLTTLRIREEVDAVVDINPHRQGMFMPGTGQPIVAPEALIAAPPHTIIIMNPIYRSEISAQLASMGLAPEILTL
jgi:SAM-dependent methyltransferase